MFLTWIACTAALWCLRPDRDYLFPPLGFTDSWFYTSFHWDLKGQLAQFGPNYFESRLSWNLPGALLHWLLPPAAAEITLKLTVSALLALPLGATVHRAAGLRPALLTVALGVLSPQLIVCLHQDYVDTPVILYASLTLACLVQARDARPWRWWIFLSGCGFAAMAIANLGSVSLLGPGLAVFHLLWNRWGLRRQLSSLLPGGLGVAAVLLLLGGIHVLLGGAFNFMRPQVDMVLYFHGTPANPYTPPNWRWLYEATWLILPISTVLWGLHRLARSPLAPGDSVRLQRALTGALLASLACGLTMQARGIAVLSNYLYASYLLGFTLPLLAALGGTGPDSHRPPVATLVPWLVVLAGFVVAGRPLFSWTSLAPFQRLVPTPLSLPWLIAGTLLLLGLLAALALPHGMFRRVARGELLVTGLTVCSIPTWFSGPYLTDHLRERYTRVHDSYRFLAREFAPGGYVFWLHPDEPGGEALASTRFRPLLTTKLFPELEPGAVTDKEVIIPCPPGRGPETLQAATRVLAAIGLRPVAPRCRPAAPGAGPGFDLVCFGLQQSSGHGPGEVAGVMALQPRRWWRKSCRP